MTDRGLVNVLPLAREASRGECDDELPTRTEKNPQVREQRRKMREAHTYTPSDRRGLVLAEKPADVPMLDEPRGGTDVVAAVEDKPGDLSWPTFGVKFGVPARKLEVARSSPEVNDEESVPGEPPLPPLVRPAPVVARSDSRPPYEEPVTLPLAVGRSPSVEVKLVLPMPAPLPSPDADSADEVAPAPLV